MNLLDPGLLPSSRIARIALMDKLIASVQWLLDNPAGRTSKALARNDEGFEVAATDPTACQWCVIGRLAHDLDITFPEPEQRQTPLERRGQIIDLTHEAVYPMYEALGIKQYTLISANDFYTSRGLTQDESLNQLLHLLAARRVNLDTEKLER